MIQIFRHPGLTSLQQGLVAATSLVGIMVGSVLFGAWSDKKGYLFFFRFCPALILAASLFTFFTADLFGLVTGLFFMGLGIGGGYSLDSDYISEIMPRRWKLLMVGVAKAASSLGSIAAAAICFSLLREWHDPHLWNRLLLLVAVMAVVMLLCRIRFEQSPGWLIAHGRTSEAEKAVRYFLGPDVEIGEIRNRPNKTQMPKVAWSDLFKPGQVKKLIFSGIPWACEGLGVYGIGVFLPVLVMALGLETAKTPLLQDLYEELLKQPEPEARRVATALELYCTGSLNLFNHPTNVNLNSRVVCIVLKGLGENLRKIAMHTTNEFVTAAVNANHKAGIATWCYFDEFHILLRDELTASYFVAVWKMLRKKGCVPSALTQNVKDLLASPAISNILDNTDFLILLSQAQSDRAILAKQLGISEHQLSYITHSNSGEGLLFYGNVTIPFVDRFPKGEIYNLLTTRPEDMAHERKDE